MLKTEINALPLANLLSFDTNILLGQLTPLTFVSQLINIGV